MPMQVKWFGWKRDLPDRRDYKFTPRKAIMRNLPHKVDLRPYLPRVFDQGALGSCTANAGACLALYLIKKERDPLFIPSRLAIYYWTREREGTVNEDSGASLRETMKVLTAIGTPNEKQWWYDVNKFAVRPGKKVLLEANKHKLDEYSSVDQDLDHLKAALADGYPIIFGFAVYPSFDSPEVSKTGIVPMPSGDEPCIGGHAVTLVGYDDDTRMFIVRNSWGDDWGLKGNFMMPYEYVIDNDLADDFWTAKTIY